MKTKLINVDGVALVAPLDWEPRHSKLESYPDSCGAGEGLGEKLVPDKLFGLRISAACCVHDFDFEHAEPRWDEFHAASFRFARNVYAIIRAKSGWTMGLARTAQASFYFYFVDTKGAKVFKTLKEKQGHEVT